MIKAADEMCPHMIISFDNQMKKARDPIQDTLALMSGMVSFRKRLVKDGSAGTGSENKGKTIRMLDRVPGG